MLKQLLNTFVPQEEGASVTPRKQLDKAAKDKSIELEKLSRSQDETKKAMLNVMEDLEAAKNLLELEKAKDEAMLDSIGDGVVGVDKDGIIIVINQAGCDLLKFKSQALLGKRIVEVIEMEDEKGERVSKDKRPVNMVLAQHKPTTSSSSSSSSSEPFYQYIRSDGTKFPAGITARPIINKGKTIGAIEVFRDISRELEIDRAKSEFVSLASHQLRTPLGIIKWYLEALENESYYHKAPLEIRKYFDEIYKNNERVLSLVRDLLSVSRIDQGRVKDSPKSFDLLQLVTEIVEQMQIIASKKKITLILNIQNHKIPPVNIDNLRLREVIENLIVNALEYTLPEGSVTINVDRINDMILISVKDTGIGISQADQKKIFTKFFRSEKAVSHNPEGSGLGLYVVRSYVQNWGGKISLTSAEGVGSKFTISLPIRQKER